MRSNFISEAKSGIRPLFLLLIVTATICVGQTVHGTIIDGGTRLPTPTPTATPASFAYVTVRTEPDGLYYEANGVIYSSTQTIQVPVPGDISLRAISPQFGPDGTRYLWNRWSDGGDISHVQHFEFSTFYEVGASFRTQYLLTVEQPPCRIGSVTPGTGFMDAGQPFELRAFNVPGSGYLFEHWIGSGNGSYSGRDNPTLM